jgi:hypothetical protein
MSFKSKGYFKPAMQNESRKLKNMLLCILQGKQVFPLNKLKYTAICFLNRAQRCF